MKQKLILIDDEPKAGRLMERYLEDSYDCRIFQDPLAAMNYFNDHGADLVITDMQMPNLTGSEVLAQIRAVDKQIPVIVITAYSTVDNAIEVLRLGATDFIKKPFDIEELKITIDKALNVSRIKAENYRLKQRLKAREDQDDRYRMIGTGGNMQKVYDIIDKIADIRCNVIIEGESGTGKELVARAIHFQSQSADKPFIVIDCGALTDSLLQSELFGYEKGAFTDAKTSKQGLVEIADGGTLFLDEIGELSLTLQPKLLRFLENGEFRHVGGVTTLTANVRVIAATNRNLLEYAEEKKFRRDLLFRLNVITLTIPPLAERGKDILLLAEYFLDKKSSIHAKKKLSPEAKSELMNYEFPGNVRELEHMIERAIIFSENDLIELKDLNLPKFRSAPEYMGEDDDQFLKLEDIERLHIRKALNQNEWNREQTARALGISQKTLYSKIKKYSLK